MTMVALVSQRPVARLSLGISQGEGERISRILDYSEPHSTNLFQLRKPLGRYAAGEFIDRITLEALLFPAT